MRLTIVSYNLNGIRSAIKKGLIEWLEATAPDVVCFQELKAYPEQIPTELFTAIGYTEQHWHAAEKAGYSGVGIISRLPLTDVVAGMGNNDYDREGRVLRATVADVTVLSCYFPSGTSGEERQGVKMNFLNDFVPFALALRETHPNLVIVGDYNIAHTERDIHNPKGNQKTSGFLPEERAWMTEWLAAGFADAFRHANPEAQTYSWWSTRFNSRAQNKGWRIDYQSVSKSIANRIHEADQMTDAVHSDHCPVRVVYEWEAE